MEALQGLKYKVQTIMTEKNEEASDIDAYAEQLVEHISQFDAVISSLEREIQLLTDSEEAKSRCREDQEQEVEFRKKIGAGEAVRRNEDGDEKAVREERKKEDPKAKLPKLVISKFEGTALDWFRFWNQFETEIDQQDHISPVTKYSYLKEFYYPMFVS